MQNLLEELKSTLEIDDRLVIDGKLNKNKIVEMALALDGELLTLLLKNDTIKKHFFKEVSGTLIFDKIEFQRFVSNKQFLPDSYTAFKNKIGLTANGEYLTESKEVVLAWPYKDCVLEGGQTKEDQKRKEVFWNATLAPDEIDRLLDPKVLTNFKKYDKDGEHELKEITKEDNFIMRGNNLLALHSLKKAYSNEVKLIYIDPPFNTGSDGFNYNDSFNHSSWLTFIANRIEIAHELLTKDGVIFIHIDDKEYSHLKLIMDEKFGRDNFLNLIVVKTSDPSGHKTVNPSPYSQTEYILMYARDRHQFKYDIVPVESEYDTGYNQYIINYDEPFENWEFTNINEFLAKEEGYKSTREANKELGKGVFYEKVAEFALNNRNRVVQFTAISNDAGKDIVELRDKSKEEPERVFKFERDTEDVFIRNGRQVYFYANKVKSIDGKLTPTKPLTNLWSDIPYNGISNEGGVKLKNGKKPEKLLRRIIEMTTDPGELVLDFFSGSGTTVAVAQKLGRRFIGIEQLDYGDNDVTNRLVNVINGDPSGVSKKVNWKGGGSFIYAELKQSNATFVEQIEAAKYTASLWKIWEQMQETGFISYRIQPKTINAEKSSFEELSLEEQKQFLIELLDKNQLYVNYSEIDDETYQVSEEEKRLNRDFYRLSR